MPPDAPQHLRTKADGDDERFLATTIRRAGKSNLIDVDTAPNAQLRTLFHEITHALGVDNQTYTRGQAEVIVDTVSFIVCSGAGLAVSNARRRPRSALKVRREVADPDALTSGALVRIMTDAASSDGVRCP
jgi:hypothetical protein